MPSIERDYYEVLSVERTADGEEIKRSYRRLAMKYHPDRNPGDSDAEVKFKECAAAYEVLSDPAKRQRYDQFGHEGLRGSGAAAAHHMQVDDIFSMFADIFGGGAGGARGGARGRGPARGYDLETVVTLSLEEVATGAERTVEFTRMDICEKCSGSGAKPGSKPVTCPTCGGHGQVQQSGLGGMFRMVTACPSCGGRGKVVKDFCPECRGKGRVATLRKLSLRIPPGIADGQAVRVRGEGEPPAIDEAPQGHGQRGDLHVVVRVKPHGIFRREGSSLLLDRPISFTQAALGAEVDVPTIAGERVKLAIPRGTQHGTILRIPEQGLPDLQHGKRGDLIVSVKVEIPRKLSTAQEKLLREFATGENESVLPESQGFFKKMKDALGG